VFAFVVAAQLSRPKMGTPMHTTRAHGQPGEQWAGEHIGARCSADVAEVVVQCLKLNASRFSFDLASRDGPATTDFNKLLGQLSGLDTDYSLPENNPVPYSHLAFM
jgi:hypothetical protein